MTQSRRSVLKWIASLGIVSLFVGSTLPIAFREMFDTKQEHAPTGYGYNYGEDYGE